MWKCKGRGTEDDYNIPSHCSQSVVQKAACFYLFLGRPYGVTGGLIKCS